MVPFVIETQGRFQPHVEQEWLLTNGTGAFAGSTVVGCNTRCYHALLIAATKPPLGRIAALNRVAEIIRIDGSHIRHELAINYFPHEILPRGERYLRRFELGHTARFEYEIERVKLTKEVMLLWRRNVVAVRYALDPAGHHVQLDLAPFVSLRDFHGTRHRGEGEFTTDAAEQRVVVATPDHAIHLHADRARFMRDPQWWLAHKYPIESERGLGDTEDLFTPGHFTLSTSEPATLLLWAAMEPVEQIDWMAELHLCREAVRYRIVRSAASPTLSPPPPHEEVSTDVRRLIHAANDFVVARTCPDGTAGTTIIAGYPWFADWGRDTMISLPGLLLVTGRFDEARQVLRLFAEYVSEGMIPNRFDDYNNEPHYNTVDASLWFIHAVHEYLRLSGDRAIYEQILLPACRKIIDGYSRGTRYNIKMDEDDALITQGDETTQLTWMDAKHDGMVFTPRHGKAVEINALWYNALMLLGEVDLADRVRRSFVERFWISPFRGLSDVVNGNGRDNSIRPNQIFAVSLPFSPLNHDQQLAVVEVVRRELLTPVGLRSLAVGDPKFQPIYGGKKARRDEAYHNGTIWSWLIGPFLEAYLRAHGRSPQTIDQASQWLRPLIEHMSREGCIGSISEIFEAQEPHRPVGCYAQAWSIAEVLRLAVELEM
jgi:predicted glycogen debranching enzyme